MFADLPLTDTHLHLWDLDRSPYAWMSGAPALRRTGRWEEVIPVLVEVGATRVILVQADDTPEDTAHLQETARAIEADARVPRAHVVGWLPLARPAEVEAALADHRRTDHLVGVRHLVHDDPDPGFLERPEVAASLELLAEAGLPLDVPDAHPRHMEQVVRLAHAHPRLTIVLDHLGKPPLGEDAAMRDWRRLIEPIADCPGVVAKISGLSTSGDGEVGPAVAAALELFGTARLMLGSDWPIAPEPFHLASGFLPLLDHVESMGLDGTDVVRLRSGTAERVYVGIVR